MSCAGSIRQDGESYLVNGHKIWISGACDTRCKVAIFMGKNDPAAPTHKQQCMVLVPMDTPGVRVIRAMTVFGQDDAPHGHAEMVFDDVRYGNLVPRTCPFCVPSKVLNKRDSYKTIATDVMFLSCFGICTLQTVLKYRKRSVCSAFSLHTVCIKRLEHSFILLQRRSLELATSLQSSQRQHYTWRRTGF
jgi:hypothetical protein